MDKDLLNHPIITERYFFPRPGQPRQARDFLAPDGVRLRCLEHSIGATRTLVHFHGNGEIVSDYEDGYLKSVAALGVNLLMVEYRGYGGSGGTAELGKMLDDVRVVRESCALRPDQVILYGRSVGAIFAVEWAFQEPGVAGLVLESGVADPLQRLAIRMTPQELGVEEDELRAVCEAHLNHQQKLRDFPGALLVMHAQGDTLVGSDHALAHMEYAVRARKKLVLFPRGDHNTAMSANWSSYLESLAEFFRSF